MFEIFSLRASASGFVVLTAALFYFVFGLLEFQEGFRFSVRLMSSKV